MPESSPSAAEPIPAVAVTFLTAMMLLTGVCNTLLTKYQDNQCVKNCDFDDRGGPVRFQQPLLQTAQMFCGEAGCWLVACLLPFLRRPISKPGHPTPGCLADNIDEHLPLPSGRHNTSTRQLPLLRGKHTLLLAIPAICDICGTTLMNAGLLLVAASLYQMTRGTLVVFVGLFSSFFLRSRLRRSQWLSLVGIVAGIAAVGFAGAVRPDTTEHIPAVLLRAADEELPSTVKVVLGTLAIAFAQVFTAMQFVMEEWILGNYSLAPLQAVGYEGWFGLLLTLLLMILMHLIVGHSQNGQHGYLNMNEGLREMMQPRIGISSILIMASVGSFNFFGLSVTREISATSRSTIDICRTVFIWLISLGLGWESFKPLQLFGFSLLVYSTLVFNEIIHLPFVLIEINEATRLLPGDF